jgi:hypothetical protein
MKLIVHPSFQHTLDEPPIALPRQHPLRYSDLPTSVLLNIASHLSAHDLLRLQATCKEMNHLASSDELWRDLCVRKFNVPYWQEPASWRKLYKFNHQLFVTIFTKAGAGSGTASSSRHFGPDFTHGPLLIRR